MPTKTLKIEVWVAGVEVEQGGGTRRHKAAQQLTNAQVG